MSLAPTPVSLKRRDIEDREGREDRGHKGHKGHRGNRAELADTFIKVLKTENRITDSLTGFNNMQRC